VSRNDRLNRIEERLRFRLGHPREGSRVVLGLEAMLPLSKTLSMRRSAAEKAELCFNFGVDAAPKEENHA
jgi:hypothetical protein